MRPSLWILVLFVHRAVCSLFPPASLWMGLSGQCRCCKPGHDLKQNNFTARQSLCLSLSLMHIRCDGQILSFEYFFNWPDGETVHSYHFYYYVYMCIIQFVNILELWNCNLLDTQTALKYSYGNHSIHGFNYFAISLLLGWKIQFPVFENKFFSRLDSIVLGLDNRFHWTATWWNLPMRPHLCQPCNKAEGKWREEINCLGVIFVFCFDVRRACARARARFNALFHASPPEHVEKLWRARCQPWLGTREAAGGNVPAGE